MCKIIFQTRKKSCNEDYVSIQNTFFCVGMHTDMQQPFFGYFSNDSQQVTVKYKSLTSDQASEDLVRGFNIYFESTVLWLPLHISF